MSQEKSQNDGEASNQSQIGQSVLDSLVIQLETISEDIDDFIDENPINGSMMSAEDILLFIV